ncbi:unnamed protein product, partial [Staurois parvus]
TGHSGSELLYPALENRQAVEFKKPKAYYIVFCTTCHLGGFCPLCWDNRPELSPQSRFVTGFHSQAVMEVPDWKFHLLERKRKEEEEAKRKEREEEERLAKMPAWKREIILRRKAKAEASMLENKVELE